ATLGEEALRAPRRILVPRIVLPDGRLQDSAQAEPASAATALAALMPPAALPRVLAQRIEPWRGEVPGAAAWGLGACLVAGAETLRRLGPFDEGIFMFGEDLDLGLRARDADIGIEHRPDARVFHGRAHSTHRAYGGEPFELLAERRRDVVEKRRGRARRRADDVIQALTFANRIALKTLLRRGTERERAQLRGLRAARKR
ncbi:MAG: glycosyltransferase family 2 protein, partial [Thermoleophilaceae bacterium]|nr:glycosyltransferase family 2 protein [Thermoleophilaceae bacterium]